MPSATISHSVRPLTDKHSFNAAIVPGNDKSMTAKQVIEQHGVTSVRPQDVSESVPDNSRKSALATVRMENSHQQSTDSPFVSEPVVNYKSPLVYARQFVGVHPTPRSTRTFFYPSFATQLHNLPTNPSPCDTRSLTALMALLENIAGDQYSTGKELVNNGFRLVVSLAEDIHCSPEENDDDDDDSVDIPEDVARAINRTWTRNELGVGPFETNIPPQHVREFDNPAKNPTFLLGWAQTSRYHGDATGPQFTNPWDGNKVIAQDDSDRDSSWNEGSPFTSGRRSFSGSSLTNSSVSLSPASILRDINDQTREWSIDTQMTALGMESRLSL
ncbi:hypothetical protein K435DRAFT_788293 [Dendrothele bispora CBS 962.96]|uniref:Uncharacterized protein n=1 Tax=Dendrothele bispora (strain CBS 962.96) TaxID=1314807 RepID=A0A4S8MX81_DENBC|nr:hypothetical protein K435DRAFT_788293 [Dendrothele bispora CBS 962.96]